MFDGHCHLDKKRGSCRKAISFLYNEARKAKITGMILLNVPRIAFPNEQVLALAREYNGFFKVFPSPSFDKDSFGCIRQFKKKGAAGIKLHPRLEQKKIDNRFYVALIQRAADLDMPVLIDCFPDGKNFALGNIPEKFALLAEKVPQARIAIGHAGGHRILDALTVAKYYKNIYLDLSYTVLYYRGSQVTQDIAYAINSIKGKRAFWGSDYPDRPYHQTVNLSLKEFSRMKISLQYRKAILENNIKEFLGKNA